MACVKISSDYLSIYQLNSGPLVAYLIINHEKRGQLVANTSKYQAIIIDYHILQQQIMIITAN